MGQRREILERLEALERRMRSRHDDHGHGCGQHHRHDHGQDRRDDFDEKRVIDTIVRCVTEQVEKVLASHQEERRERGRDHGEGGNEKRVVDLIVACVSEHVQEIVATELDKRLGRPEGPRTSPDRKGGGTPETDAS